MSQVPDAWADEWSTAADTPGRPLDANSESKKVPGKSTKAQRRAQQAEFNRQFWAEAEGPSQPNYFLESRNVVPLRQEFKPPTVLLSRKGPIVQSRATHNSNAPIGAPSEALQNLTIASPNRNNNNNNESSDDEEDTPETRQAALLLRQAQAVKDREEKQRKYEERRLELFGPPQTANNTTNTASNGNGNINSSLRPHSRSGTSSPGSNTPPHSRSSTPSSRGGGRRGRGNNRGPGAGQGSYGASYAHSPHAQVQAQAQAQAQAQIQQRNQNQYQHQHQHQHQQQIQIQQQQFRELYDPSYAPRPESIMARQGRSGTTTPTTTVSSDTPQSVKQHSIQPVRAPRGPDGSGRGGFGFASRGGRFDSSTTTNNSEALQVETL